MSEALPVVIFDVSKSLTATKAEIRQFIADVEEAAKTAPQLEIPHKGYHSGNVYGREISPPKGMLIVGKIHRHATLNFLLKGVVDVFSQDGCERFVAPCTFVSTPGAKRVIYVVEDATWTCCHGTESLDEDEIEKEFIAQSYDDVVEHTPEFAAQLKSFNSKPLELEAPEAAQDEQEK